MVVEGIACIELRRRRTVVQGVGAWLPDDMTVERSKESKT
jgi:hypothetical protein